MSLQIYEYPLKCFVIIGRSKTAADLWEFKNDEEKDILLWWLACLPHDLKLCAAVY